MKLTILAFLLLTTTSASFAQPLPAEADYLQKHAAVLKNSFQNAGNVLTPQVLKSQLFLIGENHGIEHSYQMEYELLKHLKEKVNVKYLLVELGMVDGIVLNKYLRTGDEKFLEHFFAMHKRTFFWNKSGAEFFRKLYQLNKTYSDSDKIVILPVDLEFAYRFSIDYLKDNIFTSEKIGGEAARMLQQISHTDSAMAVIKKFNAAYVVLETQPDHYRRLLGDNYEDAVSVMRNIKERFIISINKSSDTRRDSVMFNNFLYWKKRYNISEEKMVGIFGNFHVKQVQQPQDTRFAAILKNSGKTGPITSLMMVYQDSWMMWKNNIPANDTAQLKHLFVERKVVNDPSLDEPLANLELMEPFKKYKAVLFHLDEAGSPFRQSRSFLKDSEKYAHTTDMFQLLLLINGSPATKPYGPVAEY